MSWQLVQVNLMPLILKSLEFLKCAWLQRSLLQDLIKRDIQGRYKGSVGGVFWSLVTPILMLGIYTFFFSVIFKARWSDASEGKMFFAVNLFAGMIVHSMFSECVNRSPKLILDNVNFVKRVVFPLELLPWVGMGTAIYHGAVSFIVLLVFTLIINQGVLPWTIGLVPFILIPLCMLILGISWFLASLGVYLRDIAQTTTLFTSILMFMSPVFYPVSALPEAYRPLVYINPLTLIIEQLRMVLVQGQVPSMIEWSLLLVVCWIICILGYSWFQKTRKGFADVI